MRVVIRVDASVNIGSGHVMRCITLAKILKNNSAIVEFICREHEGNLIDYIRSMSFKTHVLKSKLTSESNTIDNFLHHSDWLDTTQQQDAKECRDILEKIQTDWLIVDHYAIDKLWQSLLVGMYKKLMVVDDLSDREHVCDILLDYSYNQNLNRYDNLVPKSCKLLLGADFCLIRPEFLQWRKYSLDHHKNNRLKKLLVTMGGSDKKNITSEILKNMHLFGVPDDISITVVLGGLSPHIESIKKQVVLLPFNITIKENVSNMAELMSNTDLVISAAGSTIWEIFCLGVPNILIAVEKNQLQVMQEFNKIGLDFIDYSQENFITDIKDKLYNFSDNSGEKWKRIVDGKGANRVVDVLLH